MIDPIHRRTFLALAGAAGSASAMPAFAMAADMRRIVLIDARLSEREMAQISSMDRRLATAIDHANVLHWRRELLDRLGERSSVTAFARWDIAMLLADLGREASCDVAASQDASGTIVTHISKAGF